VGSRLLPLVLATAALAAGTLGLVGLALWLGLLAVPAAAAVTFVAISDTLEGRPALLTAGTSVAALLFVVLASVARSSAPTDGAAAPLATWGLVLALLAYGIPLVVWVLEPMRVPRRSRPGPYAPHRLPQTRPLRSSSERTNLGSTCDSCSRAISTDSKPHLRKSGNSVVLALVKGEVNKNVLIPNLMPPPELRLF